MRRWIPAVLVAALVVAAAAMLVHDDDYELQVLAPSADGTFVGARAQINGLEVGHVTEIGVMGDQARITVSVDDEHAPLHAGTDARIRWNSVLGRRTVELLPGSTKNAVLPSGKLITSTVERVEIDDILAALDTPTRERVRALVGQLEATLGENEGNLQATLTSAGPFVEALGNVLEGVGQDGPAIRSLVQRLHEMTQTLASRDVELAGTVRNLSALVAAVSREQEQLKAALDEVPATVQAGTDLFARVPAAVDATMPLLEDLKPAIHQLPGVAANLEPVLADLRPTIAELRPTLTAAQSLLRYSPDLLDSAHRTVPEVETALAAAQPALEFLRPYTPETIGFISNWTSLFSAKNRSGHFGRALIIESATTITDTPLGLPPGFIQDPTPAPGSLVGQAWTDANGDSIR
jgi:phospholipid/cholesterol/gamma-HCH transport system substrate-binding protein